MDTNVEKKWHRWVAIAVALLMLATLAVPVNVAKASAATTNLQNPRTTSDGTVTWDCVWFGHYPQSADGKGGFNNDPIKWRVLSVDENEALLLADKNLDGRIPYNERYTNVTWETCTMRSWLNGYGSGANQEGIDYTSDNFIDRAFTANEKNAILQKTVENADNPYHGTEGGNNTSDKLFLPSIGEMTNPAYGFPSDPDEEADSRKVKNTAYTANKESMNEEGETDWYWLRSPGQYRDNAADVRYVGDVYRYGRGSVVSNTSGDGVRPALRLNLTSNLWSYAGTVSSDGTMVELVALGGGGGEAVQNGTVAGTLQGVDYLGFAIRIDGIQYPTSGDFDMTKALTIYNEYDNKTVAACLEDGEVTRIDPVSEAMYAKITVFSDVKNINYQDEKMEMDTIPAKVEVEAVARKPYDLNVLKQVQDPNCSLYVDSVHLNSSKGSFQLEKEGWLTPGEMSTDLEIQTSLKPGEKKEVSFEIYVADSYVPEDVTDQVTIYGTASVNEESKSNFSISIGNLDLQRAQEAAKKAQRESGKALAEAKKGLDGLQTVTDPAMANYFSNAELKKINQCVNTWVAGIIATSNLIREDEAGLIDQIRAKTGLSDDDIVSAVLGKMGVNVNVLTQVTNTKATTTILARDKNGKEAEIHYSVNLGYHSFQDAPPYSGFGTLDYYIILDDGSKNGRKVKSQAKGVVTYSNIQTFYKQLQMVAEGSIKSVYDAAWGKNADKVAEMIIGAPISKLLNKTVGTFSNNVFNLLKAPTQMVAGRSTAYAESEEEEMLYSKKISVSGPANITMRDADGKICGTVTNGTVDSAYAALHMYAEEDETGIYVTEDDYTLQITGSDTGTLTYTVEEYQDGQLLRNIQYDNIPISKGKSYYSTIPDAVYLDNAVYNPVSDTKELIASSKDSWQDTQHAYTSVTGVKLNPTSRTLTVGQQAQMKAILEPTDATNPDVTWTSSNKSVATVSDTGMVKAVGTGTAAIQVETFDGNFTAKCTVTVRNQTVKASQSITAQSFTKTYGNISFNLGAKAKTKLSYKSSNTKVATVSSTGLVTLKGPGKATITITAAATTNYNAASKNITITVKPKKATLKKAKSTKKRTLKVMWKRDTKATGYQVVIAQNKKFKKGKKTALIKKNKTTSRTFKKLKSRKNYYYKVRAYKQVGKTKIYGAYSKAKRIKVK